MRERERENQKIRKTEKQRDGEETKEHDRLTDCEERTRKKRE